MNHHLTTEFGDRVLIMNDATMPIIREALTRSKPHLADAISATIRTGTTFHDDGNFLNRDDRRMLLIIRDNLKTIHWT